ncbi:MAG TPA: alkaline phosphatase family protein, partial [Candidatus Dormibacteraeota bacterium]
STTEQSTASGAASGEQAAWDLASPSGAQSYAATLSASTTWTGAIAAFKVSTGPPPVPTITSFSPASGVVGTSVVINGTGFTGATNVAFNGTNQTPTVNSDIKITATVPSGASGTGPIKVTAPGGIATSSTNFTVTPSTPHVLIIVEENQESTSIIGSSNAPYINGLVSAYRSATQWYAVQHNSPTDYMELLSGSNQGWPVTARSVAAQTLVDELHTKSIPWKAYMESMPSSPTCTTATDPTGLYEVIHNPFRYFTRYTTNSGGWCSSANQNTEGVLRYPGASGLVSALNGSNAPDFVWITPNDCNDMHGDSNSGSTCKGVTGGPLIKAGDTWLSSNLSGVLTSNWFKQNGTVIITWDEGTTNNGCCVLPAPAGGHIATVVISSTNAGKGTFTSPGDHYGTLRGIEEAYGVTLLGGSTNIANGDLKGAF